MALCFHPSFVLCHMPFLLLLLQLPQGEFTEDFLVIGPSDPIVAVLGGDITLPCRVSPAMSVKNMELRWFRSKFSEAVFIYQNRKELTEEQLPQYAGRTSLVKDLLEQGEAAVRIRLVRVSDDGAYTCFFKQGSFYEEAGLELKVAGVGSTPQVHITGPEEDGVRIVCSTLGWFPKPQVQWRDPHGEKFLAFSEVQAQDPEGLFSVEATLVVRDSSVGSVTCSVLNPILGQEKAMAMVIPEPFFPRTSPWKPAFLVILSLLLLLLLGAAFYTWREHSTHMQELQKQRSLCQAKEVDRQTKEEAMKETDGLKAMLDQRKEAYLNAWKKAQIYADWRKEKFCALPVSLDPSSAHPSISVSHDKKTLSLGDTYQDSGDTCNILGLEDIKSGHWYWEVEVKNGDKSSWALGICRKDVKRTGWVREYPEKGFWLVGNFESGFGAQTLQNVQLFPMEFPHRIGVFLDYVQGDISFYNMMDGSHIFSFPPATFSGVLLPYFACYSGDVSMILCPLEAGLQEPSGPFLDPPSLEEPVVPSGEGLHLVSGVHVTPPGPEAPLLSCNS